MTTETTALVPVHEAEGENAPVPVFRAQQMALAFAAYLELQNTFDKLIPPREVGDKLYRVKAFWRAVAVAFGLVMRLVEERREVRGQFLDGRDNFGYVVVYEAVAPNGRTAV